MVGSISVVGAGLAVIGAGIGIGQDRKSVV